MNEQTVFATRKKTTFTYTLPWIISTAGFATLSAILYLRNGSYHNHFGTYERGFETDFGTYAFYPILGAEACILSNANET